MKHNQKVSSKEQRTAKFIAGVLVHNYHLTKGYQMSRAGSLLEANQTEEEVMQDWTLVFKNSATDGSIASRCNGKGGLMGHPDEGGVPMCAVHGSQKDVADIIEGHADEFLIVEPDLPVYAIPEVHDPASALQARESFLEAEKSWGLTKIGTPTRSTQGQGVHIYVLDTGVRTTHSDFGGRAIPTLEVTSSVPQECHGSTSCARDVHGHGTHCAGSAAGTTYGVAPKATVHGVKVLSDSGTGSGSWTVAAIDWVISKGERPAVVSMSLGAKGTSYSDKVAIDQASNAGITVVVASGNENDNACGYSPAYVPSAITVGSTDQYDRRSSFSNYGSCVQIYAPGSDITSAGHSYDSQSATMSGTSMACPHVSGAAALLLESNSGWGPSEVKQRLLSNAKDNILSGLTSADPNKLLYVGGSGGSAPSPTPTGECQYDDSICKSYCQYDFCSGCSVCR